MADDDTFESAGSGASLTTPVQAGALKKGHFVCINGNPCKVVEITTSKTGKHGHAKANITALDIFTGKKLEEVAPTSHNLEQPVVKRTEYNLLDVSPNGMLSFMDGAGEVREDLSLPADQELAKEIKDKMEAGANVDLVIVAAMGKEQVLDFKENRE